MVSLSLGGEGDGGKRNLRVVIEGGDGGEEGGGIGRRGKEKNMNLRVGVKVGGVMKEKCGDRGVV